MGITSGIVLYAVIWFMTFLVVIPIRLQTQGTRERSCRALMPGHPSATI